MLEQMLIKAKQATKSIQNTSLENIDKALLSISETLFKNMDQIIEANKIDLVEGQKKGLSSAMLERLELNEKKITGICSDVKAVMQLNSPVDEIMESNVMANEMRVDKVRVPFGVIAAIYESRPNVSVDIATLCLKTKNVCVLKGGSEAINSNKILVKLMREAVKNFLDENAITLIESTDRQVVSDLITKKEYIDLVVPRGGKGLIRFVVDNSKVPVIETGAGNCHVYVDDEADLEMAVNITYNAKTSRPSVCNSIENVLVHEKIAEKFLPLMKQSMPNVELRGCERTKKIIECNTASDEDFYTEYNDFILSVKVVDSLEEAINHINEHSTKHSEAIVTANGAKAEVFMEMVDSACVYHNVSTRYTDGGCFGMGAELGISTQKLHARGPMALKEMTTYKYKIYGNGQVR